MSATRKLLLGTITKDLAAKLLRDKGRELAAALRSALPSSYGFVVVLRGDDDALAFFSDSEREEAARMMRTVLAKLEGP